MVLKILISGIFFLSGLYLLWLGRAAFSVPSVWVLLFGGALLFVSIALIILGVVAFSFWHVVWVRNLVIAAGGLLLVWFILTQFTKSAKQNELTRSAKEIVLDWCHQEGLEEPKEDIFKGSYISSCRPYDFRVGIMGGAEGTYPALFAMRSKQNSIQVIGEAIIPLPSTADQARPMLLKLKNDSR